MNHPDLPQDLPAGIKLRWDFSVAFCSPRSKFKTFSGLMASPLVGKKLFSPNSPWQTAPLLCVHHELSAAARRFAGAAPGRQLAFQGDCSEGACAGVHLGAQNGRRLAWSLHDPLKTGQCFPCILGNDLIFKGSWRL